MQSIREIFKIGYGPSSSHTMGPASAVKIFLQKNPETEKIRVNLYGSLSATGKGHHTDSAIIKTAHPIPADIVWKEEELPFHPNGMILEAFDRNNNPIDSWEVYSIGGGELNDKTNFRTKQASLYKLSRMEDILKWCGKTGKNLWEYVEECEGKEIWDYLDTVWKAMERAIENGLKNEGVLPGDIHLARKAANYYIKAKNSDKGLKDKGLLFAYALAVSEENAGGGKVVTAPTCGSAGVLPSVLYFTKHRYNINKSKVLRALAIAGLIGNLLKTNGSISGAEVGCQGEIGSASAMAAGAAAYLLGGTPQQIEYAAEMGIENHLGLTCDPVGSYVQIPCIERNAFAADTARECAVYALFSDGNHKISFDEAVQVMLETGKDMQSKYRETGKGGLALIRQEKFFRKE